VSDSLVAAELWAEVRVLRLQNARLRAALEVAQRHLNPPVGPRMDSESPDSGLCGDLSPDPAANGRESDPASQDRTARIDPSFTSGSEPVSVLRGGIVVSPSVLAARHTIRVEDNGGDIDDEESDIL
jgi:hypothetical protein